MQARVEIRSQAEQGVETHPDEKIIADEGDQAAEHGHDHENKAEPKGDLFQRSRAEPMLDECTRLLGPSTIYLKGHGLSELTMIATKVRTTPPSVGQR